MSRHLYNTIIQCGTEDDKDDEYQTNILDSVDKDSWAHKYTDLDKYIGHRIVKINEVMKLEKNVFAIFVLMFFF